MNLGAVTAQDLKRLLELFPIADLRKAWPEHKGTKEEVCFAAAAAKEYDRIGAFVQDHFSCCKQHVYAMSVADNINLPPAIQGEVATVTQPGKSLFILRVTYDVVLRDPLEEMAVDFLWPIQVELTDTPTKALLLRFVVLEKGVSQYFTRPCYVAGRSIEERSVVSELDAAAIGRVDLHKGIKTLWGNGFMDSSFAKLKKALSMASEVMDEELGIREHNPELYGQIVDNTLLSALFAISDENCGVSVFSVQPSNGYLAFPRYSAKGGTDHVISEILRNN